jgi:hypothetical protein
VIDSAALPVFDGEALLIMAFAGCVTRFSLQARVIVQVQRQLHESNNHSVGEGPSTRDQRCRTEG